MKKLIVFLLLVSVLTTGCFKENEKDVYSKVSKKISELDSYYLKGDLEMLNGEDTFRYKVEVNYKKSDNFRVVLKNSSNDHEQIILKNKEGVYVITPSLNKSFKFQSEWPYNNSQAYLLQTIMSDLDNDNDKKITINDNEYIMESKVNYLNNRKLQKQKVYFSKKGVIQKVEVIDENNTIKVTMKFTTVSYNKKTNDEIFILDSNISASSSENVSKELEDIIYPLYIPLNTTLSKQDEVKLENGKRVIQSFEGDNPFVFIQETMNKTEEFTIIPMDGTPVLLGDSIGALSEYSLTWSQNGIDYYLASDTVSKEEMIEVASSVNNLTLIK